MLDTLAHGLHQIAVDKGFWPEKVDDIFMAKQCMMIVSEVTETMEAIRKDKGGEEVADEMADIIIRTLDLYAGLLDHGYTSVSLDYAITKKTRFNTERPRKHGVRF